ncbi:LppA family lipoprotein [Amycolatopsis orientalis]|uniref:LppA family lipoprotein n=1 Tax=Amycolatopsis orientalis TaxID=31958 RepID=UPI00131A0FA6|nr:LppA family lipoprotein [Amycolatopsis orientalis]
MVKGLPNWTAEGNIPDGMWPHAVDAVRSIAAQYGFGTSQITVDRPGDHEVVFHDQYPAELNVGTATHWLSSHRCCQEAWCTGAEAAVLAAENESPGQPVCSR